MKNICFNSCLNTNEVEHFFFFLLLFNRHLVIPKYARGMLDAGCALAKSEVMAFPCSFTHSFFCSFIHSFIRRLFLGLPLCAGQGVRVRVRGRERRTEARAPRLPACKGHGILVRSRREEQRVQSGVCLSPDGSVRTPAPEPRGHSPAPA